MIIERTIVHGMALQQPGTEKKEDIRLIPMTKGPTSTEKSKKQRDNTKSHSNFDYTAIADRLDLGRSVGVTAATQLARLNRFTGFQPFH